MGCWVHVSVVVAIIWRPSSRILINFYRIKLTSTCVVGWAIVVIIVCSPAVNFVVKCKFDTSFINTASVINQISFPTFIHFHFFSLVVDCGDGTAMYVP